MKELVRQNYEVPPDLLENPSALLECANESIDVAIKTSKK